MTTLQKQGINFTVSGRNIDVKAVQIPQSNIPNGLGFANFVQDSLSMIFNDPEDIPVEEADVTIAVPQEVIKRFKEQGRSKYLGPYVQIKSRVVLPMVVSILFPFLSLERIR